MTRSLALRSLLAALIVCLGPVSCGDAAGHREPLAQDSNASIGPASLTLGAVDPANAGEDAGIADTGVGTTPEGGPPEVVVLLTDEEFVGVLMAIHEGQILLALAGQTNATDPRVQSLGAAVAADHRNERVRQLALGIFPASSDHASAYVEGATGLLRILEAQPPGAAFDSMYIDLQLLFDTIVIEHIDRQWTASTQNPELAAELALTREAVQRHLERALALRDELLGAAP